MYMAVCIAMQYGYNNSLNTIHTTSIATVEPLYKGHIGTSYFVHCREVVHSSEVKNVLTL